MSYDLYWTIPGLMAVVYTYVGILTVDVVFFRSPSIFHSQDSFPSTFRPMRDILRRKFHRWPSCWTTYSWGCLPQPRTKRRGEGILRMEDAGTSEEDDIDSQDSNIRIDHGHQARNCSIKIIRHYVQFWLRCTFYDNFIHSVMHFPLV